MKKSAKQLSVPEKHQLRIARDTLKMSDQMVGVMGAMTKAEARQVIAYLTGKAKKNPEQDMKPFAVKGKHATALITKDKGSKHVGELLSASGGRFPVDKQGRTYKTFITLAGAKKWARTIVKRFDAAAEGRKNPGMFGPEAVAKAKRVTKIRAIKDRTTGELGEIVGAAKGQWVKVKWRNRDKPTMIQRSEIVSVRAKKNPHSSHARLSAKRTVKAGNLYKRAQKMFSRAAKLDKSGFHQEAAKIGAQAIALQRRFFASGAGGEAWPGGTHTEGPIGRLPNPQDWERFDPKWLAWLRSLTVAELAVELRKHRANALEADAIRAIIGEKDRANRRKNPSVTELAETFQGKVNGAVSEYKAASSAPADLARIGKLVFLKLRDVRRQIAAPGAMVAVDTRGRLWIVGRGALFTNKAAPGTLNDFGEVEKICYRTAKAHIGGGELAEYVHAFGEDGGKRPRLLIDSEGMPILRGGDYKIQAEGIID